MRAGMSKGTPMAVTLNEFDNREGGARDRWARALGVACAIYGLLALITAAVGVAGVFGLAGLQADASASDAARMMALPWSLAAGPAEADPIGALGVIVGGLVVNLLILIVGSRLARGRNGVA
jgi:hypothetical protein